MIIKADCPIQVATESSGTKTEEELNGCPVVSIAPLDKGSKELELLGFGTNPDESES